MGARKGDGSAGGEDVSDAVEGEGGGMGWCVEVVLGLPLCAAQMVCSLTLLGAGDVAPGEACLVGGAGEGGTAHWAFSSFSLSPLCPLDLLPSLLLVCVTKLSPGLGVCVCVCGVCVCV